VNPPHLSPDLQVLIDLFYNSSDELGTFTEVEANEIPSPYRELLAHDKHMTVTVEAFHGCPVDVKVVKTHTTDTHYSRKILLHRQKDCQVVQFGLVRLNLDYLGPDVRAEIESQKEPLGRILIKHNVMRNVRLLSLWKIEPSEELCQLLGLARPQTCYGRTALIYCNSVPAVELLEIVTP
jgi:chorismate-pyruvate lyase